MGDGQHDGHLAEVYAAQTTEAVAEGYDGWAQSYEADMARAGYRHPAVCLALLARHLPAGSGPVLDAGCGTGLIGSWLSILGYPEAEGLDLSTGMLDVARGKGAYRALHRLALGSALPFADGAFAGIVSAGVFTTGHVGADGLDELARICRPPGAMVLTVKLPLWEAGFPEHATALGLRLAEVTEPYISMPGDSATVPSVAAVFAKD